MPRYGHRFSGQSASEPLTPQLYGLETDLGITDKQYLICLGMFFFTYAFFEVKGETTSFSSFSSNALTCANHASSPQPASNVFLRRLKPSIWLSGMMLLWGAFMVSLNRLLAEFTE